MATDVDEAVDHVMNSGLHQAEPDQIIRSLDAELQQQTTASAAVLGAEENAPWVLGGAEGGGFGSMAQRFVNFYSEALHREICDPQGGLKSTYTQLLGDQSTRDQVKSLAPVVLAALGVSASLVSPATVAAIVALWLLRVGLQQWCAAPPPATDAGQASGGADAGASAGAAAPDAPAAPPA